MPFDSKAVREQANYMLSFYVQRSPRSGTLQIIAQYQGLMQKMLMNINELILEKSNIQSNYKKFLACLTQFWCQYVVDDGEIDLTGSPLNIALFKLAAKEMHDERAKQLFATFYEFLQAASELEQHKKTNETTIDEKFILNKALAFLGAYRNYFMAHSRKKERSEVFLTTFLKSIRTMINTKLLSAERAKNDTQTLSALAFLKYCKLSKEFSALPKLTVFDFSYFPSKEEKDYIQTLHHEISSLTTHEHSIVLAYLCQGKRAFNLPEISRIIVSPGKPEQGMPIPYLENCLVRIAEAIKVAALWYIHLPKETMTPKSSFPLTPLEIKVEPLSKPENVGARSTCTVH